MRGILLMCHSSPFYGKWAYNMAWSIRSLSDLPIHLVHDKKSIEGIDLSVFNSTKEHEFGKDFCYEKIDLFDKSPFDETLYLDVDGIVINDVGLLMDKLKGVDIWTQPMGTGRREDNITYTWAKNDTVWERYKLKEGSLFTTTQTSVIYFTKSAKGFFDKLKENYKNRLDESEYREMWGKSKQHPDELYYSITLAQLGVTLEELKPVFFPERIENLGTILKDYYILSMYGGNNVKPYAKDLYDRIMHKVMSDKGRNHIYKVHNLYRNKFISR